MPNADNTTHLQSLIDRLRAGDEAARDELISRSRKRLQRLAHRQLDRFPSARARLAQTEDVVQDAVIRLMEALEQVPVSSVAGYFGLASKKMRELLIELTRRLPPPAAMGGSAATTNSPGVNPAAETAGPATRAERTELHSQVENLPEDDREVFELIHYMGLTQAEVAELLGCSVRTVKRRWQEARLKLRAILQDEEPGH